MKKVLFFLVIIFFITSCATAPYELPVKHVAAPSFNPNKHYKLAILIEPNTKLPSRLIEDEFMKLLISKGYTISSRSDVMSIMRELKFQHKGLTDGDASKIGKMLNVPAVLIVSLTNYHKESGWINISVGARMIDVEKAEILWLGSCKDGNSRYAFRYMMDRISNSIARKIPTIKDVYNLGPGKVLNSIRSPSFDPKKIDKIAVLVNPYVSSRYSRRMGLKGELRGLRSQKSTPQMRAVEDEFFRVLIEKGYKIPSRSDVKAIMEELKFQHKGLTDDDASEIGKMLNVPAVLIIQTTHHSRYRGKKGFYKIYTKLGGRLIDIEKNEILWVGTAYGYNSYDRGELIVELSEKLAHKIPKRF